MDEEMFHREFECVPVVSVLSQRILQEEFRKIHEELGDPIKDWRLRLGAAKQIRSLLIAGAADYADFDNQLMLLDDSIIQCLQDLRSQVVREICITIMYCSTQLGSRFDHLAEALLPSLICLVSNSAKIISTSAIVSIYAIIRNSRSPRLVPLITCHLSSKAQSIRRESLGFLELILHTWPTESLIKHSTSLKNALSRGITDADAKARKHARKAFVGFMQHFKTESDGLMVLLDRRMQKLLHSEMKQSLDRTQQSQQAQQLQRHTRHDSGESVSTNQDQDDDGVDSVTGKTHPRSVNFYSNKASSDCGDSLDNYPSERSSIAREEQFEPEEFEEVVPAPKPMTQQVTVKRAKNIPLMPRRVRAESTSDMPSLSEEDLFLQQCEDVPPIRIMSARDLARQMTLIRSTLSDCNCDWEKRVEAAQAIRALLLANAAEYIEFYALLRKLEIALQLALKDLHLAVMRETSITLCFLSMRLGCRFDHCAEILLPTIVSLLSNSIKDIAMATTVTFRVIIQNTQTEKLIPIIVSNFSSKFSVVRRENYKAMAEVIENWSVDIMEDHMELMEESLTSGINDPEPSVRAEARSAYYLFMGKYSRAKNSSPRSRLSVQRRRQEEVVEESDDGDSVCDQASSVRGEPVWVPGGGWRMPPSHDREQPREITCISNSYSQSAKGCCSSESEYDTNCSVQRQKLSRRSGDQSVEIEEQVQWDGRSKSPPRYERANRQRNTVTQSPKIHQPPVEPYHPRHSHRSSIPVAQTARQCMRARIAASDIVRLSPVTEEEVREKPSDRCTPACSDIDETMPLPVDDVIPPTVDKCHGDNSVVWTETREKSPVLNTNPDEPKHIQIEERYPSPTPTPAHTPHVRSTHTVQRNEPLEKSRKETTKTSRMCGEIFHQDIMEMLSMVSSSSWTERKEGLRTLQNQLNNNQLLNKLELSKLIEIFNLMFLDPNERVYSVFVDTLVMLIERQYQDLGEWLNVCLTRLLTKYSSDMMSNSLKARVEKCLSVMRTCFPYEDQTKVLLRFIIELEMQNFRLVITVLRYFNLIIPAMTSPALINTSDMRLVTSRIIRWVTEPGSIEIRKVSLDILYNMYDMNNDEFRNMLGELPRAFQESAMKMLHVGPISLQRLGRVPRKRKPHSRHVETIGAPSHGRPMLEYGDDAMSVNSYDSADDLPQEGAKVCYKGGILQEMGDGSSQDKYNQHYVGQPPKLLELIADLSMHDRSDNVRANLCEGLVKLSQDCISDEMYLPSIFTCLLEILNDSEEKTRMLTLQAMTELLRQPHFDSAINSLSEYAHDIIEKVLQMHLDSNLTVKTSAEDCAAMLVRSFPPIRNIQVLIPIVERSKKLIRLTAINMMSETIKRLCEDEVTTVVGKIVPGLLKGYDSAVGNVRKASVHCLVVLHEVVGAEVMQPYLINVTDTKRKLLNVYIKRGT